MSLLIAIAFSAYSLHLVCQERLPWQSKKQQKRKAASARIAPVLP